MKTKLLTILLLVFTSTIKAIDFKVGNLYYKLLSSKNKTVTIIYSDEYTTLKEVIVPDSVAYDNTTYSVISISKNAFQYCSSIERMTLSSNITSIDKSAFIGCFFTDGNFVNNSTLNAEENDYWGAIFAEKDLDGLIINNTTVVGCRNYVTNITIPYYITHIESEVFYRCPLLTSIVWNARESSPLLWGGGTNELGASMPTYDPFSKWEKWGTESIRHQITSITFGDSVEHIPASLCWNMVNLSSVTIPNYVRSINYKAFAGCKGLVSVKLPEHLEIIGRQTFSDCDALRAIELPKSITTIDEEAFSDCDALEKFTIPSNVTTIGKDVFMECMFAKSNFTNNSILDAEENGYWGAVIGDEEIEGMLLRKDSIIDCRKHITSVNIPNKATTIGESAFSDCDSITTIVIPDNITTIEPCAFYDCAKLASITISDNVTKIGKNAFSYSAYYDDKSNWQDGVLYIDNYLIKADTYSALGDYTIKDNTLLIADEAFYGHRQITTLTIPNSVTHIGNSSLSSCNALTSVNIPASVRYIGDNAFSYCSNLSGFNIPEDSQIKNIGNRAFEYCRHLASFNIPNSVVNIGEYAFNECTSLESIVIPDNVENLGRYSFYNCNSLASVKVGNGIGTINEYTFCKCPSLTSVTLPENLTTIGNGAFSTCSSLSSVTIPDSVKNIGKYAFALTALYEIHIPDNVVSIEDYCFQDCSYLIHATIGQNVKNIGYWTFKNCNRLSSVIWNTRNCIEAPNFPIYDKITSFTFGDSVEHIPAYLCGGMNKLTSVTIPNSVKSIGKNAFQNCISLTETIYAGGIKNWCNIKFENVTSNPNYYAKNLIIDGVDVTEVEIPNDVDSIYTGAFYGCTKLSSLIIPESVTSIGEEAFAECRKLYDIYCYATVPPVASENSFANYNANLYVPDNNLRDYQMDMVFGSFKYIQPLGSGANNITDTEADNNNNSQIYDMQGRRLNSNIKPKIGVYIINGKITMITK